MFGVRTFARTAACALTPVLIALTTPTAAAEPDPAPDEPPIPAPAPANSTPLGPLAQSDAPGGPGGVPADLATGALLLGQNPIPLPPGSAPEGAPVSPPSLSPWNNAYLLPQNEQPAAPGQGTVVGVIPGSESAETSRLDYLRRLYTSYQDGAFTGALLGKHPDGVAPGDPLPLPAEEGPPG